MNILKFISDRPIGRHILFIIFTTLFLVWLIMAYLKHYTLHGQSIIVPDFVGISTDKLDENTSKNNLTYLIVDSIYDFTKPKGTVVSQEPYPGAKVKQNRTVYITVVAKMPEQVSVPNVIDLSLRQAMSMLETYGLRVGRLEYIPSEFKNAVLEQKFRGHHVKPDMKVKVGSAIDLVLGDGLKPGKIRTPFLIGKTFTEAHKILNSLSLNIGDETFLNFSDTSEARVFRQKPEYNNDTPLRMGETVSLWYKSNKKFNFDNYIKELQKDTSKTMNND
jgi:eukaryotic-like serine/threonine-protein kinase